MRNKRIRANIALIYALELTRTKYLHAGYWMDGDELKLENLQKAQERYTEKLIELIPANVQMILDVGCGVGGNAIKLREKGFQVEGLAPRSLSRKTLQGKYSSWNPLPSNNIRRFQKR
jgi:MPBQ/MSBQ methyltransferase